MTEPPGTRPSLLLRLRDICDAEAWRQFVELYGPLVYRFARRRLQDADAADVTQDVLWGVCGAIGRFDHDPGRCSFRGWLSTLVHNKLCDFLERRQRRARAGGLGAGGSGPQILEQIAGDEEESWDEEHQRRLFTWAAGRAQAEFTAPTWQAFWQTAVENREARAVAGELGLSVGAVYVAKSRVLARFKELVQQADPR
jgi:RNA polymerase sigma-70 factor (ECF subfamily)